MGAEEGRESDDVGRSWVAGLVSADKVLGGDEVIFSNYTLDNP